MAAIGSAAPVRSLLLALMMSAATGLAGAAAAEAPPSSGRPAAADADVGRQPSFDPLDIRIGRALFRRPWVPAPSSTRADDGLGPLFDARSCAACHPGSRRAAVKAEPDGVLDGRGVILVLGRPDGSGDPVYGRRLQIDAVPGLRPEGILGISDNTLPDGRIHRIPTVRDLGYGPLAPDTGMSLRASPDLHGRGALERVPDEAILAVAREQAAGTDGVRGMARRVIRPDGSSAIGRFGWKASQPSLASQSAEAFFLDLGLSTPLHPQPWGDCTSAQATCRAAPHGGQDGSSIEIPAALLDRVVAYVASLDVPAGGEPEDGRLRPTPASTGTPRSGRQLFGAAGCATCHRPSLPDGHGGAVHMFTDLLLHDLGPGLADTMPEPGVQASQWRTAPLAGIADALSRRTGLLHDGRARDIEEAVRWHGGEASVAVRHYDELSPAERSALLAYVASL